MTTLECTTGALQPATSNEKKEILLTYYMAATLCIPFDEAVSRTEAALKTEGFGVISLFYS